MVFDLFFIAWQWKRSEVCNEFNALSNVANAFQNNNSALESVSNGGWKTFNAFLTYLLCRVFANRVTYRPTHPTETAIRRLVVIKFGMTEARRLNWPLMTYDNSVHRHDMIINTLAISFDTLNYHNVTQQHSRNWIVQLTLTMSFKTEICRVHSLTTSACFCVPVRPDSPERSAGSFPNSGW